MPSPEQFYQSRPLEIPQTDHGGLAEQPTTSPYMEQVVTRLAVAHDVDLSQKGVKFMFDVPNQPQRWLFGNIDGARIGVARCQVDAENQMAPDLDMVFAITPEGWEPVEIVHAEGPWDEFAQAAQAQALTVFDPQGNLRYDVFTEFWAQQLAQPGGLELIDQVDESRGLAGSVAGVVP